MAGEREDSRQYMAYFVAFENNGIMITGQWDNMQMATNQRKPVVVNRQKFSCALLVGDVQVHILCRFKEHNSGVLQGTAEFFLIQR